MEDQHKVVGYTFDLISVAGVKLASKQLDGSFTDELDAHLAMWQVLQDAHVLKAELDGKLVTLLPDGVMMLQISGYVYG